MNERKVSGIMFILLLTSMLTLAFNVTPIVVDAGLAELPENYQTIRQADGGKISNFMVSQESLLNEGFNMDVSAEENPKPYSVDESRWDFDRISEWGEFAKVDDDSAELIIGVDDAKPNSYTEIMYIISENGGDLVDTVSMGGKVCAVVADIPLTTASSFATDVQVASLSRYIEPNMKFQACFVPNDPYWLQQWGPAKIEADYAWDIETGSPNVVIAVVDTGVDWDHPDLAANIWNNTDEVVDGKDADGNGYIDDIRGYDFVDTTASVYPGEDGLVRDNNPMDFHGHGTHCSGIISAVANNSIGVAGTCWNCKIMAVRAGYKAANGYGYLENDDCAAAIIYAANNGADIISMSWGGGFSNLLKDAIDYAYSKGVVLVAAMGNDNAKYAYYPSAFSKVIAVSATDSSDGKASFSNYGSWADVAAPGESIYSTMYNDTYSYASGTSMSTPFVAGLAALILSKNPTFANEEIRSILHSSTDNVSSTQYIGIGRINAFKAIQLDNVILTSLDSSLDEATVRGNLSIVGTANGTGFQNYTVEYGSGIYPSNWTKIGETVSSSVVNGLLAVWDTTKETDGVYTIKLKSYDAYGNVFLDMAVVNVKNAEITIGSPLLKSALRFGDLISIEGTASASKFVNFTIDYEEKANPGIWRSEGIALTKNGSEEVINGVLGTWDTNLLASSGYYNFRVVLNYGYNFQKIQQNEIHFDPTIMKGWPLTERNVAAITLADMDNDGDLEIIAGGNHQSMDMIHVWHHNGTNAEGWPVRLEGNAEVHPPVAVGDVDNDGNLEIIAGHGLNARTVYVYRNNGTSMKNWPQTDAGGGGVPVLADVDNDGDLEIFVGGKQLSGWHHNGSMITGWPKSFPAYSPAIANINNDNYVELIVCAGNKLYIFDHQGNTLPGWPISMETDAASSPVLGDINNDGDLEIVASLTNSKIIAYDLDGQVLAGWPVSGGNGSPVLGDIDDDGDLEIFVCGSPSSVVFAWYHNGTLLPGWPVYPPYFAIRGVEPVLADVNGDGRTDIVVSVEMSGETYERIYAYDSNGSLINGWPKMLRYIWGYGILSTPAVADLDKDGDIEVVVSTNGYVVMDTDVYVWDLNSPYNQSNIEWGTYRHDIAHTGLYGLHDIAIANVTISETAVKGGQLVHLTITTRNEGNFPETFSITTRANTTTIETKTSSLPSGNSTTLTSTWNTTGVTPGNYIITAYATSVPGETDTEDNTYTDGTVKIVKNPVATFTYSPTNPLTGQTVTFNASLSTPGGGTIISYFWDFGDETNATGIITSHTYTDNGTYTVTLTVTDDGLTDTDSQNITVLNRPPIASFTESATTVPTGIIITFNASASYDPDGSIVNYFWNFGDGTNATGFTVDHAYVDDGNYTVTLTVTDDDGSTNSSSSTKTVLNRPPIAIFTESAETVYTGEVIYFNASDSYDVDGVIVSYFWDFGDGSNATGITVGHAYSDDGTYTVTLTVTDDDGATDTANSTKTVLNRLPVALFTESAETVYTGEAITFNASSSYDPDGYIVSYEWDFGDGNITVVTSSIITHAYADNGTYTVILTVTDNDGETDSSSAVKTVLSRPPVASFVEDKHTVYTGEVIQFNASTSYDPDGFIVSYSWDFGDGSNATGIVVEHTYRDNGNYTVILTITDNDDATASTNATKTVLNRPPVAIFIESAETVYTDETINFNASASYDLDGTIISYFWDFGDGANATGVLVNHAYAGNGTYTVTLTVTDDDGTSTSTKATKTVLNRPDIAVTNVTTSKTIVGQGYNVSLSVTVENQGNYTETFNITVYANTTSIASQNVILTSGNSTTLTFTWNTTGFASGSYIISAYVEPVLGETDIVDNRFVDGIVKVFLLEGPYYTWYGVEYWIVELIEGKAARIVSNYY